ncbi:hypothetical protein N9O56_01335 [Rickettsiales bacterium]|nr:hypothetical protein [Rickettsiales bacterium]
MIKYLEKFYNLPNIGDDSLEKYSSLAKIYYSNLVSEINNNEIAPLHISSKTDDLPNIQNIADKIRNNYKEILVLGVGGSSLGARTLCSIKDNANIKLRFLESIDSLSIKKQLQKINLKDVFFIVISKSGKTIETICQTLITIDLLKQNNISNLSDRFLFITQDRKSEIGQMAQNLDAKILEHPSNIGGRYSYLTVVGLLPAALIGLDIFKIRKAANDILNNFINEKDVNKNNIIKSCIYQIYLFDQGFRSTVLMPYIDSLYSFNNWYRQLWSESLGKNGFGLTPINSMGTVDQHSQLQLYLDGPKDKFFNFIINNNPVDDFKINDLENIKTIFGGKNLTDIVNAEQKSTIDILLSNNSPLRLFEMTEISEESVSGLMMQMFLEAILIARVKNINPFDQPAVEKRKILSKKYINND